MICGLTPGEVVECTIGQLRLWLEAGQRVKGREMAVMLAVVRTGMCGEKSDVRRLQDRLLKG